MRFRAIVNEPTLLEYLHRHGDLAFDAHDPDRAVSFMPAVDGAAFQRRDRPSGARRFVFYARPKHPRNLFDLGLRALSDAVEQRAFDEIEWEFSAIGGETRVATRSPGGACYGRPHGSRTGTTPRFLADSDVLLSLMLSPHTSYPPLEMATAGGLVITNTFSTKTAAALMAISTAIRGTPPEVGHLSAAIAQAASDVASGRPETDGTTLPKVLGRVVEGRRALGRGDDRIGPRPVVFLMSTRSAVERPSQIVFVASRDRVPQPSDGALVMVMDTAWTLGPGERRDLLSLRPMVARVVERVDLYETRWRRLDLWASAASVIERTTLDGISLWHGIREQAWRWLHERLLWASVVESISRDHDVVDFRCDPTEVALRQVLEAGGYGMAHGSTTPDQPGATAPGATVPMAARIDQRVFAALAVVARRARRRAGALGPSSGSAMAPDTAG